MAVGRKYFRRTEHTGSFGPRGYHPRAWRKAVSRKVRRWNGQREIAKALAEEIVAGFAEQQEAS